MSYSIQIGGGPALPLAEIGVSRATLTTTNQGEDTLTLTIPHRIYLAGIAPAFSKIILRDADTIRFVGWLDSAPRAAAPGSQTLTLAISGPWRFLTRKYYTPDDTGAYILGRPANGDETHLPVFEIINAVLDHAQTASGGAFTFTALSSASFNVEIPWRRRNDDLCGTILRNLFAHVPTAVQRWTYTGTPHLAIIDTHGVPPAHHLDATTPLTNLPQLRRRDDLLRNSVKIIYKSGENVVGTDIAGSAGDAAALGANFEQIYTFGLSDREPVPAPGLAAKLAAWHQKAHVDTTLETLGIDWTPRPGEIWGYGEGSAYDQWSPYTSICQQITRDLFSRKQTTTLGVPAAPSTYRLSQTSNNNPSDTPDPTGTLTIAIDGPDGDDDFDPAAAKWTVGDQSGSGSSTIDLPPGDYTITFATISDTTTGKTYSAPAAEVTITKLATTEVTGTYTLWARIQLTTTDGEHTIDINAADITPHAPPEGDARTLKIRKSTVCHMGQPGWILRLESASWPQEEE